MKTKHMEIDSVDRAILLELKKNCRRSYRELSKTIMISPAALIERIKKMEESSIISKLFCYH